MKNYFFRMLMVLFFVISMTSFANALPEVSPESVGLSSERLARIDLLLNDDMKQGVIPGAVLLVSRKGKVAYFKAYGYQDSEKKQPMQKDSIFRIYSMTKPFIGVMSAMLMEQGKIALDDPVEKYIPAFKNMNVAVYQKNQAGETVRSLVKSKRPVTLFHLLTHTSGIGYGWSAPKEFQKEYYAVGLKSDWTIEEQSNAIAGLPLQAHPGEKYVYGRSFDVMGRVLEVVSGMPLDQLLKTQIFDPLHMDDTGFNPRQTERLVFMDPKTPFYNDFSKTNIRFGGGSDAVSTAMDYANFAQMLLNGGRLGDARLLGPKTLKYISSDHLGILGHRTDQSYFPGAGYGGGFGFYARVSDVQSLFPGNEGEFYKAGYSGTVFWVDPKEDLTAVFMICEPGQRLRYRSIIKTMIYQSIIE